MLLGAVRQRSEIGEVGGESRGIRNRVDRGWIVNGNVRSVNECGQGIGRDTETATREVGKGGMEIMGWRRRRNSVEGRERCQNLTEMRGCDWECDRREPEISASGERERDSFGERERDRESGKLREGLDGDEQGRRRGGNVRLGKVGKIEGGLGRGKSG